MTLFILFAFMFGAALGSFSHLVADRLHIKTIWSGRSECMNCGKKLSWRELVPIFSFIKQKGKCTTCKCNLNQSYVWSEVVSGMLVAFLAYHVLVLGLSPLYSFAVFIFYSIVITLSMAIIVYDLRHTIVPFESVMILLVMGLVATLVRQQFNGFNIYDFFSGAIIASPFALLYMVSKGKWVGMGDVLVYAAFGFLLGLPLGISMFFYSVWLGAFVSVLLLILHRRDFTLKSEIPFTPFIIIAAFLVMFANIDMLNLYEMLH